MTKEERIARYGIEKYERQLELGRVRAKRWRQENLERDAENHKRYQESHKQEKAAYDKEYRAAHKEEKRNRDKIYREENRTKIKEQKKAAYKEAYKTKLGRAKILKASYDKYDRLSGLSNKGNITAEWIVDNIFSGQKCVYCGEQDWKRLGCDRIDNTKPHTEDNIVPACGICNMTRVDRYTVEEFKQYRSIHPRVCDIPKSTSLEKTDKGAIKKKIILNI